MKPRPAPVANASIVIASITTNGSPSRRARSLNVPGSDSSALQTTYLGEPFAARTAAHLRPVGNAAPPRPSSFDAVTSAIDALRRRARTARASAS